MIYAQDKQHAPERVELKGVLAEFRDALEEGVSQILCKHRRAVNNRAKIIYWGDGLSATP